jgi:hypothetical protein
VPSLEAVSTAAAAVIAIVAYVGSSRRDRSLHRAELVHAFSSEFAADDVLSDLFMDIDYGRFRFDADGAAGWLGHTGERNPIRLLDLFNSVGHNVSRGVLSIRDIQGTTLGYAIMRTYADEQITRYLDHVDRWDKSHRGTGAAFHYFRELAVELERHSRKSRRLVAGSERSAAQDQDGGDG